MDVKYQIFISSTFRDLQEERRKVIEQILNLGHIPVGMELFQAGDDSQWSYIQKRIAECDYYLVVIAERYGSQVRGKSYTQMEYEFAVSQNIPVISFLLESSARGSWPQEKIEFEHRAKIDKFRSTCEKKLVRYWKNADELAAQVVTSIVKIISDRPGVGWVRADAIPSEEALSELARLSAENAQLRRRLVALEHEERNPILLFSELYDLLVQLKVSDFQLNREKRPKHDDPLLLVFAAIAQQLALGLPDYTVTSLISGMCYGHEESLDFRPLFSKLVMVGLVDGEEIRPAVPRPDPGIFLRPIVPAAYTLIKLTEVGKRFYAFLDKAETNWAALRGPSEVAG